MLCGTQIKQRLYCALHKLSVMCEENAPFFSTEYLNTLSENCLSFDRSRARHFYGKEYITWPKDLKCLSQCLIKYNVGRRKRERRNISMRNTR
jgi:hypothetical protein